MVPMRAEKRKGALHEPPPHPFPLAIRWGEGGRRSGEGWFMVPMRAEKRKGAFHEPRGTSNIEHPTPNIAWQRESSLISAFGVRCWMFDVFPRFRGLNARIFISGKSLPIGWGEGGRRPGEGKAEPPFAGRGQVCHFLSESKSQSMNHYAARV